ncbi:protein of unknown function [Neorhodopirellula lusitana]|uniref:DNA mimic protein DMP19 C-terminal domain-containing protein n=2 Tax=Neorhodopirellula lusitana TaxID=445327 RepID=A0ABY1QQQ4_9BACT|nr:protein of unknown function [Neorhodopirellula lusitana]
MDWYELTDEYHGQTLKFDGKLSSLSHDWQRELASVWRLEADVSNGTYLQFIENWNVESYDFALQCLKHIGARKMARIIEKCHKLVLKHTDPALPDSERFRDLMSNPVINSDGSMTTPPPSPLPDKVVQKVYALSYRFMDYPDDIAELGVAYYRPKVDAHR